MHRHAIRWAIVCLAWFATFLISPVAWAQRDDGQYWPCNPMQNASCPPNLGLNQYSYYVDFTNPPADLNTYWSTSNYASITYNTKGKNGAEFTFAKRYDAPQLFTNFYIFFGRVDVVLQVAPGTGIISSSVLISDDFDEIDWEMSGNNFNLSKYYPNGVVQNNYFSKGITGAYDRGQWQECSQPQSTFHTYSVDWSPTKLEWLLDGKVIRTFLASNADTSTHQFPQTPSKIQLGIWAGGDPGQNAGTINWAGGMTNLSGGPYTMFVKSVSVKNYNPAKYYNWTDQSGSWKSIKPLNASVPSASKTSTAASTSTSTQSLRTDLPISPNGQCGSTANKICKGSLFGDCCSAYGYCGNTSDYCNTGCLPAYGRCGSSSSSTSSSSSSRLVSSIATSKSTQALSSTISQKPSVTSSSTKPLSMSMSGTSKTLPSITTTSRAPSTTSRVTTTSTSVKATSSSRPATTAKWGYWGWDGWHGW